MKFYWADCFTHLTPILVQGLGVVLEITIISFILFMLIASLLAIGQVAGPKPLRKIIGVFSEIIRGTPALVQVVYIYYVIPILYAYIRSLFTGKFAYPDMSPIAAGIAGLSICYGAYVGEVIRSAIVNIDGVDQLVRIGDILSGFEFISITRNKVVIRSDDNIYRASVGQPLNAEKITNPIEISNLETKFKGSVRRR